MKKLLMIALLATAAVLPARNSYAATKSLWGGNYGEDKAFVVYADLEMFLPMNVEDGLAKDAKATVATCVAGTCALAVPAPPVVNSASYNIDTSNAYGLRMGLFHPIPDFGEFGMSVGYIPGPNSTVGFAGKDASGTSFMDFDRTVSFVRLLGEFKQAYPMGERLDFNPAIGAGVAFGKNTVRFVRANGDFSNFLGESDSWSGFTWEASLGLALRLEKQEVNLAVKYAAFPEYKGDAAKNLSKISWGTLGFSFGVSY